MDFYDKLNRQDEERRKQLDRWIGMTEDDDVEFSVATLERLRAAERVWSPYGANATARPCAFCGQAGVTGPAVRKYCPPCSRAINYR